MQQDKQQNAERLFFQTELSNSVIAETVGVSRRTLYYWVKDNEWDRLKKSAQHMPSLLAENMYLIMAKMQADLMAEAHAYTPVTPQEMKMVDMASRTIQRLRNRHTVNETLELQAHLMDYVQQQHPEAVATLQPIIKGFLKSRAKVQPHQFMAGRLNDTGAVMQTERDILESQLDLENMMYWAENPGKSPDDIEETIEQTSIPAKEHTVKAAHISQQAAPEPKSLIQKEREMLNYVLTELKAEQALFDAQPIGLAPPVTAHKPKIINPQNLNRAQRREIARKNQNKKVA
jgi:predicted DNA-binding protein YlxM (UPF0122 family)